MRVDGIGVLFHHGGSFYSLCYDRCGHEAAVVAPRWQLEHTVRTYYRQCQACARPLRWVCPGCALVLSSDTITVEEEQASGGLLVRCASYGADAWG